MIEYPTKILLATDGGEDSVTVAEAAMALSNKTGAELHVVNVGQAQSSGPGVTVEGRTSSAEPYETIVERARRLLEWQVEQIRESGGTVTETHLRIGSPPYEVVGLSGEHRLGDVRAAQREGPAVDLDRRRGRIVGQDTGGVRIAEHLASLTT